MKITEFGEQVVNCMTFRRLILLQSLSINAGTLHIPIFKPFRLVTPESQWHSLLVLGGKVASPEAAAEVSPDSQIPHTQV